jgi:hypothetical protein
MTKGNAKKAVRLIEENLEALREAWRGIPG